VPEGVEAMRALLHSGTLTQFYPHRATFACVDFQSFVKLGLEVETHGIVQSRFIADLLFMLGIVTDSCTYDLSIYLSILSILSFFSIYLSI
jgi:hypothetical protein